MYFTIKELSNISQFKFIDCIILWRCWYTESWLSSINFVILTASREPVINGGVGRWIIANDSNSY